VASASDPGVGCAVTAGEIESLVAAEGLLELPPGAAEQFSSYLGLLLKWNAKLNLTAVRESEAIVRRHFLESIQCAQSLPSVNTLLDFGSGAGFPGIPIAICRQDIRVTMGESQGKKAAFLREALRTLKLKAEVFDGRIETMSGERQFDAVTLRAVDNMAEACAVGLTRLRAGGWLVVFAGGAKRDWDLLPGISWEVERPIVGASGGILMMGRKISKCST
jgi:16S rRNA (guanine527-N7)-methyltransferase